MILSLIAAVANNNVIGNENKLIWNMPADLKHFKKTTMGHSIIMGRKTWESIRKPLKGRQNIVLTRKEFYLADGCEVVHSIDQAIKKTKHEKEVFVIGGSDIYEQCIDLFYTRRLYITRIFASFDGDAFFPDIDTEKWELEDMEEHEADEKNKYPYAFMKYKKKKSALCK
jgi:dihydrofolate reductase